MSTLTLSPVEIAARKQAAAIAELTRNGVKPPAEPRQAFGESLRSVRRRRAQERSSREERPEFVSRPDAKKMRPEDVANIQRITPNDARDLLARIALVCPQALRTAISNADEIWGNWDATDVRWELTPHAVRKLNESKSQR